MINLSFRLFQGNSNATYLYLLLFWNQFNLFFYIVLLYWRSAAFLILCASIDRNCILSSECIHHCLNGITWSIWYTNFQSTRGKTSFVIVHLQFCLFIIMKKLFELIVPSFIARSQYCLFAFLNLVLHLSMNLHGSVWRYLLLYSLTLSLIFSLLFSWYSL